MLGSGGGEALHLALAIKIENNQGATLLDCLLYILDSARPPPASPWLFFSQKLAPTALQVLQLLCRDLVMMPVVARTFREEHHSGAEFLVPSARHHGVPSGLVFPRPGRDCVEARKHVALEDDCVLVGVQHRHIQGLFCRRLQELQVRTEAVLQDPPWPHEEALQSSICPGSALYDPLRVLLPDVDATHEAAGTAAQLLEPIGSQPPPKSRRPP